MKLHKALTLAAFIGSTLVLFNLLGCSSRSMVRQESEQPGMYELTGWNGAWTSDADKTAGGIDIDGEVGRPLYVASPRARIVPAAADWSSDSRIISGHMPPGLTLESNDQISGIPTERGHWIVTLELYNLTANGRTYNGFQQQLRFHITGSGRVSN